MLHQFEHEQTIRLHHGLECLAAGIATVLCSRENCTVGPTGFSPTGVCDDADCDQEETQKLPNSGSETTPGQCDDQPTQKLSSSTESIRGGDCDQEETQKLINSGSEATPGQCDDQPTQKLSSSTESIRVGDCDQEETQKLLNSGSEATPGQCDVQPTQKLYSSIDLSTNNKRKRTCSSQEFDSTRKAGFCAADQVSLLHGKGTTLDALGEDFGNDHGCVSIDRIIPSIQGSQNQANIGANDRISKYFKFPYSPKVMELFNWVPSFDLGIEDDDVHIIRSQPDTIFPPEGVSKSNLNNVSHSVHGVTGGSYVKEDIRTLNIDRVNGAQVLNNPENHNQGRVIVTDNSKSQVPTETTPFAKGVSSMNVINMVSPDIVFSSITPQKTVVNVLQPIDVNVVNSGGSRGVGSSTCKMPAYGKRRQQQLLKPESEFRFANVKHEFEIAHKVKSLQSCELILFPILKEDHWFLFVVDIKDQKFVFLDSAVGGRSYDHTTMMNLIGNFTATFFATAKRTSVNPLDFDIDQLSPHRQKWKKDSGVFVMKYMDIWDPRVALEARFTVDDLPKIRIQLLNRMLRSNQNLVDLSCVQCLVGKGDFQHVGHQI